MTLKLTHCSQAIEQFVHNLSALLELVRANPISHSCRLNGLMAFSWFDTTGKHISDQSRQIECINLKE
jgi:hypothetical protein